MGTTGTTYPTDFDDFRDHVAGSVILPVDPAYDEARRVWNGMIDRHPAAVLRASAVGDIAEAIMFARRSALPLAVRAGGHNVAGNGTVDHGLVLDLGALRGVTVDPASATVTAEPGALLVDVDSATEPHGLGVPIGVVSATGVAGLTLGGGVGWLTRAHGLSVDNLVSVDIVTASGETVTANDSMNTDLFWAVRGGGGNFGVVSSFTFSAHPLPAGVLAGNLVYARDNWRAALRAYEEWTRDLPDALTSIISFMVPPPSWELGEEPLMLLGLVWASDDLIEGERHIARMRQAVPPDVDVVGPVRWLDWQSQADELFPRGARGYWKNASFDRMDGDVIDAIARRAEEQTWRGTGFDIHHLGGAFGRVPEAATPFPNRAARFWLNIYGFWPDPSNDAARVAFVRGLAEDMRPFDTGGRYVNFEAEDRGGDPHARALAAYGPQKLERLAAIKRRYDPDNLFRLNHNIPPG